MQRMIVVLTLLQAFAVAGAPLASSDVADAVESITGRRAHMDGDLRLLAGTRMEGPAVTLLLQPSDGASISEAGGALVAAIEGAAPGSVIVTVLTGDKSFSAVGASAAALARARRLSGFVVDGSVRDLSDLRRLAVAAVARGTVAGSAGGHYRVGGTNVPVICGGLEIRPGDWIVADGDGVSAIPHALRAQAVGAAKALRAREQALLPLIDKFGSYAKALAELTKRP